MFQYSIFFNIPIFHKLPIFQYAQSISQYTQYGSAAVLRTSICVLSRGGDRPTATILHAQFHFLIFALLFKAKYLTKYTPPRRTNYTLKWRGGEAAPPIYFIFTPSRRGIFWSNILQ